MFNIHKSWPGALERGTTPAARRSPILHRLQQFVRGWQARVTPDEKEIVAHILPDAALTLFWQMPVDAQRHSLNVLRTLQTAGWTHPDLAVAALLHDAGKSTAPQARLRLNLWWRGPLVLFEAFLPQLFRRLCSSNPAHGWRYLLYLQREHPHIGARAANAAGCSPLACWLIAHHQDKVAGDAPAEHQALLAALCRADDVN